MERIESLENLFTSLEIRMKQLESMELQFREIEEKIATIEKNRKHTPLPQVIPVNQIARTCHELRSSDPSLHSGMYYIDPDGQNIGDSPISVYCDMITGKTCLYFPFNLKLSNLYQFIDMKERLVSPTTPKLKPTSVNVLILDVIPKTSLTIPL